MTASPAARTCATATSGTDRSYARVAAGVPGSAGDYARWQPSTASLGPSVTRPTYRPLEAVPARVRPVWEGAAVALGEEPRLFAPGPGETYWIGRTSRHHVYLAVDAADRRRLELEAARLRWAADHGVPVPTVAAADPEHRWLATDLVPDDPQGGTAYVDAAVAAAEVLARAPAPPPGADAASDVSTPATTRIRRALRMLRHGVDPLAFVRLRGAVAALPDDVVTHGDFHTDNVLFDAANGRVHVTDLELLATGPAGADLCTLWCGLDDPADRRHLATQLVRDRDPNARHRLGQLLRFAALSRLADEATADHPDRDRIRGARERLRDAERTARAWAEETP